MYNVVQVTTSLRRDEVDAVEKVSIHTGNRQFRRAGTLRAMLRFALANEAQFVQWFEESEGTPFKGGEAP